MAGFALKLQPVRQSLQRVFFKFNPLFMVLTFQLLCQYLRSGSTLELKMTRPLKPLKYGSGGLKMFFILHNLF